MGGGMNKCPDSPDGNHHWLCEDFPDETWDLFCQYCFEWKDWSKDE